MFLELRQPAVAEEEFGGTEFLQELLQNADEDIQQFRRLSVESTYAGLDSGRGDGSPDREAALEDRSSGSDADAEECLPSWQSCCCGDRKGLDMQGLLRDEDSDISVATGGRFPCLHIAMFGLKQDRRYRFALDFCQIASDVDLRFLEFTEPYFIPRTNHMAGRHWMKSVLYFNLSSIANGGLQENGMTLQGNSEYEPTLRIMELDTGRSPTFMATARFPFKGSGFLAVCLASEVRDSKYSLVRFFLLVRRFETTRVTSSLQCESSYPQHQNNSSLPHHSLSDRFTPLLYVPAAMEQTTARAAHPPFLPSYWCPQQAPDPTGSFQHSSLFPRMPVTLYGPGRVSVSCTLPSHGPSLAVRRFNLGSNYGPSLRNMQLRRRRNRAVTSVSEEPHAYRDVQ